jgi:glycosyltransferase involved in cell wall biosynthesis
MIRHDNIHIYPSPIVNEGRIFKQTMSVARSGLFSKVVICGTARSDLPRQEVMTHSRTIDRLGPCEPDARSPAKEKHVAQRILAHMSWSRAVYWHCLHSNASIINAHSVAALPVCYLLSRKLKAKLIYDTHELETQTETSRGAQGLIFNLIERALIARCDAVFVVNDSIADWYRQQRRLKSAPVVVRNIPDTNSSKQPVDVRRLLSIPDSSRVFIHIGNLVSGRNIGTILDAFSFPKVDAQVVFIGDGPLAALVRERTASHPNIHLLPPVDPTDVVSYAAGCDVGLCLIQATCLSYRLSLPNKALEYIKAGIPFFFTDLPEVSRLLGHSFSNWRVEDPVRSLAQAIATLSSSVLEQAKREMAEFRIPDWDDEARSMIATYTQLTASYARDPSRFPVKSSKKATDWIRR